MLTTISILAVLSALIPAALLVANCAIFQPLPKISDEPGPAISVLIPARNEAASIEACVRSVLASLRADFELIVLNDHSEDDTAQQVAAIAQTDDRLRLEHAPVLPPGWCGKQHACFTLASLARHDLLLWIDADVRLDPDALRRLVACMQRRPGLSLLSGFPRQEMGSAGENLLIPLIHFVLLGFLPIARMRASTQPAYGAGCGQMFLARREAYITAGGHQAICASLHDGVKLPRAFRAAGLMTDIFDATDLASCRMYRTSAQTFSGLAKNATEGLGSPGGILFWTTILLLGQVVPWMLVVWAWQQHWFAATCGAVAILTTLAARWVMASRFDQPRAWIILHPLAILLLLLIQWYALARYLLGRPHAWKGRSYQTVQG